MRECGNGLQRVVAKLQSNIFELEQLLVLPDDGVLRFGQDLDQRLLVQIFQHRHHRHAADELGNESVLDQVDAAARCSSRSTSRRSRSAVRCAGLRRSMLLVLRHEAHGLGAHALGRSTFSRPTKAPPQMNRMLVVSTGVNSWWGCLRPPCGGTLAMVPSRIFSSACCTPSPETSRVMEGFSSLRQILSISSM